MFVNEFRVGELNEAPYNNSPTSHGLQYRPVIPAGRSNAHEAQTPSMVKVSFTNIKRNGYFCIHFYLRE